MKSLGEEKTTLQLSRFIYNIDPFFRSNHVLHIDSLKKNNL